MRSYQDDVLKAAGGLRAAVLTLCLAWLLSTLLVVGWACTKPETKVKVVMPVHEHAEESPDSDELDVRSVNWYYVSSAAAAAAWGLRKMIRSSSSLELIDEEDR